MNTIEQLKQEIRLLKEENKQLKTLLDNYKIKYELSLDNTSEYDLNQGKRILSHDVTLMDARRFFSMFWAREDVYAKRVVNKQTGNGAYYTQCANFWKTGCHKRLKDQIKCEQCHLKKYVPLTKEIVQAHLLGLKDDESDVIGVYPLLPDGTCRFIVFDFDDHLTNLPVIDNSKLKEEVSALTKICKILNIPVLVERSRSGTGIHVWLLFSEPINVDVVYHFAHSLLNAGMEKVNVTRFDYFDKMIPSQDGTKEVTLGNLVALPLQGKALKSGNSAFVDVHFNAYKDQWNALFSYQKMSKTFVESKIKEWNVYEDIFKQPVDNEDTDKPWNKITTFNSKDVDGSLQITLSNGIYINKRNIKPRLLNRLRKMAAFSNPKYYQNKAIGLSNYKTSSIIYLAADIDNYLRLPIGLLSAVVEKCNIANIKYKIDDQRSVGKGINVTFNGQLEKQQEDAVCALLNADSGILQAATAFGKTVVSINLITRLKVSTLILVDKTTLMDQWEDKINQFLNIDEELPTYITPTGILKTRKSCIGKLKGNMDTTTGIIDIAMVGSVCKGDEVFSHLNDYGLIIIDECHHSASDTIQEILKQVNAKHIYGVSATPQRGDRLEKINYLTIGNILYKFTAKDRAKQQGIIHLVYPRFTKTVCTQFNQKDTHPNDLYALLLQDSQRTELIVQDSVDCIKKGRTVLVLSKYKEHVNQLYASLKDKADNVFKLTGNNTRKENNEIIQRLKSISDTQSVLIIATGSLVGEGFDYPRLDTLIMATPISYKGLVEQYVGRLNRDYPKKKDVIVYDYVDHHIAMFEHMYNKRLKAYKTIGYAIYTKESMNGYSVDNAIYDMNNYLPVFEKDIVAAHHTIVISCTALSKNSVQRFIDLVNTIQDKKLKIHIVTLKPEMTPYGDSAYWLSLHQQMKQAGLLLHLVDENYQRYCIIDQHIVWYGSLNFLGKVDIEDNLMRLDSDSVASELLELSFANNKSGIDLNYQYYDELIN